MRQFSTVSEDASIGGMSIRLFSIATMPSEEHRNIKIHINGKIFLITNICKALFNYCNINIAKLAIY